MSIFTKFKEYKPKQSPLLSMRQWNRLGIVLSAAVKDEPYVPLSVYGKNRFIKQIDYTKNYYKGIRDNKTLPFLNNKPHVKEAEAIADLFLFGIKYYGQPVFSYFEVPEQRYEDVDFWRNFLKFGRITGPQVAEKRMQALHDIESDNMRFDPHDTFMDNSVDYLSKIYNVQIVDNFTKDKLPIEEKTTNSGEPWYTRKSRDFEGIPIRKLIVSQANSLTWDKVSQLPAFLGARSQPTKWLLKNDGIKLEDYVLSLYTDKLNRQQIIESLMDNIIFNFKARVISAAPSIASYQSGNLILQKTNAAKDNIITHRPYLAGPEAIKKTLMKLKQAVSDYAEKEGVIYVPFNNDIEAFDSHIKEGHAYYYHQVNKKITPRPRDIVHWEYITVSALKRPLLYLNKPIQQSLLAKNNSLAKKVVQNNLKISNTTHLNSGEPCTNDMGSDISFLFTFASRLESNPDYIKFYDYVWQKHKTSALITNGDDNMTFYELRNGTISEDLEHTVTYLRNRYGLPSADFSKKGELGYYYNQYRLTHDNRFIVPLSRMKLYWSETTQTALPPYVEVIKIWQQLEYRWECKGIEEFVKSFIVPYDKTRLGTVNYETGKRLTFNQYQSLLKQTEEQYGKTALSMLYVGKPEQDAGVIDKNGNFTTEWLKNQWDRVTTLLYGKKESKNSNKGTESTIEVEPEDPNETDLKD